MLVESPNVTAADEPSPYHRRPDLRRGHFLCPNCHSEAFELELTRVRVGDIVKSCRRVNDAAKRESFMAHAFSRSGAPDISIARGALADGVSWCVLPPVLARLGHSLADIESRRGLLEKCIGICKDCAASFEANPVPDSATHRLPLRSGPLPDLGERRADRTTDYVFTDLQAAHRNVSRDVTSKRKVRKQLADSGDIVWDMLPKLPRSVAKELRGLLTQPPDPHAGDSDAAGGGGGIGGHHRPYAHSSRGGGGGGVSSDSITAVIDQDVADLLVASSPATDTSGESSAAAPVDVPFNHWLQYELWSAMVTVCDFALPVRPGQPLDIDKSDERFSIYYGGRNRFPVPPITDLRRPWLSAPPVPIHGAIQIAQQQQQHRRTAAADDSWEQSSALLPPGLTDEERALLRTVVGGGGPPPSDSPLPTEDAYLRGAMSLDDDFAGEVTSVEDDGIDEDEDGNGSNASPRHGSGAWT